MKESRHRLGEIFDVLGNSVRIEILFYLDGSEACVKDVASEFERSNDSISRHLKILRYADLLKSRTEGRKRIYSIKRPDIVDLCYEFEDLLKRE